MEPQKYIAILGAGESGVGAAVLAKAKGFNVFVSDLGNITDAYKAELNAHQIEWEENQHSEEKILQATEIIKSPGIPDKALLVKKAVEKGIPIISEIEFAGRYTQAFMIGITGSNGKTTTTLLTFDLLKRAGFNVGLAGNVGKSFARQVATENFDYYVLELSSFQLDGMYSFKADIAVIMNITPDHLDRYEYKFENYVASKFRIIRNMTKNQKLIFCQDDEVVVARLKELNPDIELLPFTLSQKIKNGAYVDGEQMVIKLHNNEFTMDIKDLALQGKHNTYNSMVAAVAANVLSIRKETIRDCLTNFQGVEHRLEPVISVHKIEFINDSKATNVNSTWYALESMKKPVIWIVGGVDKGNDYTLLMPLVKEKVKAIVCLGVDNSKLRTVFEGKVKTLVEARSMEEAVRASYLLGTSGDVVLLSPACASFDLFQNYEDRGRQFKQAVRNL
ncbi:MAG TPA: UDP-N-acetylmuramoyl-L-alanine--D-glutamate ligase [Marinilabiliales bacterium]|nr:MAG: UDP-N-acetylmuramoylalanine--D-glutamate ligase [Bacteroidetes bacterium GWC2_40_13]OFX75789.1 MAG: UDP-N-acetylmuramoylalanine--D-glutamate ligase [Bacteroidetes bacterium GWD2_40_43]OFX94938.1 MAG: UDP-N-acetylmuramoylalanine--D-glutamate ligase [Bacteroidetes bacterium GWE2_40_63]OFY23451.1 MAG: UDP-N-acetylmuramoylalanine--D-glutamate ligase [Bacteroidetes bacterium GWF2_40_13]OFZ29423.1 MAG: UDP-N-acetylmuramoylalanine--D-glutamate ligase [Bacteroidetes bacterium RIFOXYC2_FULL_40_1